MVDAHSSPAFAEQGRIAVDRHQPVLPAEEPPDFRALQLRGHLPVARARTRPVEVEPVVPDLVELPVRDVDEEACDEPGDGIRHVLPPPLLPFLQPVVLVRVVVPGHGPRLLVEAVDSPFADRRMGGISCDVSREHREVRQPVRLPSRAVHVEPFVYFLFVRRDSSRKERFSCGAFSLSHPSLRERSSYLNLFRIASKGK